MISICWWQFIDKNYNEAYVNFGIMTMTMMRSQLASMIMLMTMTIMIILQLGSMIMMITMTMMRITASINDLIIDASCNSHHNMMMTLRTMMIILQLASMIMMMTVTTMMIILQLA